MTDCSWSPGEEPTQRVAHSNDWDRDFEAKSAANRLQIYAKMVPWT